MESEEKTQARIARVAMRNAIISKIAADNARDREARNARRWKVERDPLEYEAQKERQRREYQPRDGVAVRSYEKITAATEADHENEAKARQAKREAKRYAGMTPAQKQAKSDATAEKNWQDRRREKGVPEELIQAGLIIYIQEREAKRAAKALIDAAEAEMRANPTFGMMGSGK